MTNSLLSRLLPLCLVLIAGVVCAQDIPATKPAEKPVDPKEWKPLYDGKTLKGWKSINFGGEGEVKVDEKGQIILDTGDPLTGIVIEKADGLPKDNYEITLEANKLAGDDFFCGLTFPVHDSHASFICGGWGGGLVGISSLDGMDASENETTAYKKFESNKWYTIRVRVMGDKLQAWIDKDQLVDVDIKGKKVSTRFEVDVTKPLGISAYRTKSAIRNFQWRPIKVEK
ncbi:3-keto-disaccharide hydrolase [Anatilimnocola floriformis]|uniref:3-keto-disaccharide hydrolase n=1 Tax=Anatilimnocola floriformis TaxID=2948575 RepID=UPI0020C2FBB1|nr:DUF1080 domain-containing protein [Anatilimnocola floriformis]